VTQPASAAARLKAAAPAGAAALGIAVAVIGGTMLTSSGDNAPSAPQSVVASNASPAAPSVFEAAPPPAGVAPPADVAHAPQPPPNAGPAVPGPAFQQAPGATRPGQSMEVVVKFKDDRVVQDIVDTFWRDQAAAQRKFEAFRANRPEFAGVRLARVTYSNELVLVSDNAVAAEQRIPALRAIAARLARAPDISYAEPNLTARPGGQ
jgi:hypothetical protein